MLRYATTIFLSAFLLFLVQPLIARYILPWFGGGAGVWTACLLFFQVLLLAGYLYAHVIVSRLSPRGQMMVHIALLIGACATLPIVPSAAWKPVDQAQPVLRIVILLAVTIGLPYLALSATGPLLQAWFARTHTAFAGSTYRLYALSNLGSLLALLGYPFVVEPLLSRITQAWVWSAGFVAFALMCAWCAIKSVAGTLAAGASPSIVQPPDARRNRASPGRDARATGAAATATSERAVTVGDRILWVVLPMCGSILLLAATSQLSEEIAPVPFLWVVPLATYLITFIIAFEWPRAYDRRVFGPLLLLAPWLYLALLIDEFAGIRTQMLLYVTMLFACCMTCHGEAYRLRPPPQGRQLTAFYLAIALGGALGGAFVSIVAPLIFPFNLEIHLALFGSLALWLVCLMRDARSPFFRGANRPAWLGLIMLVMLAGFLLSRAVSHQRSQIVMQTRNFYGTLNVQAYPRIGRQAPYIKLNHGRIAHGAQIYEQEARRFPAMYYIPSSGIGIAMRLLPATPRRVGIVGLGTGAMAAWAQAGDVYRFYEINPEVERLAREAFTYLADAGHAVRGMGNGATTKSAAAGASSEGESAAAPVAPGAVEVVMGDARLSLEREASQGYDVLVLDAFSGDAVPTHLLTREAFHTYLRHMHEDGVIAVNISNRYLDLGGVVQRLAREFDMQAVLVETEMGPMQPSSASMWVLVTRNAKLLAEPELRQRGVWLKSDPRAPLWTDDYCSLWAALR
jgi:hypothetical protein